MKKIEIIKYESLNGLTYDTEAECLKHDAIFQFNESIPEEVLKIKKLLNELLNLEHSERYEYFFQITEQETPLAEKITYQILFNFDCSNTGYTNKIGDFLQKLSTLKFAFVSFRLANSFKNEKHQKTSLGENCVSLYLNDYHYKETILELEDLIKNKPTPEKILNNHLEFQDIHDSIPIWKYSNVINAMKEYAKLI